MRHKARLDQCITVMPDLQRNPHRLALSAHPKHQKMVEKSCRWRQGSFSVTNQKHLELVQDRRGDRSFKKEHVVFFFLGLQCFRGSKYTRTNTKKITTPFSLGISALSLL